MFQDDDNDDNDVDDDDNDDNDVDDDNVDDDDNDNNDDDDGTCFRFLVSFTVPEIFDRDAFAFYMAHRN
jgi:hypothetical protein